MTEIRVILAKMDGEVLETFTVQSENAKDTELRLAQLVRDHVQAEFDYQDE